MSTDDRQTTEKAILDAAETLFMERGFATTSTTDIAKRAGCNQALIHYYYRTKDKLFEAIFRRKAPVFLAAFFRSDLKDLPFEERMRRRVETHFDLLLENPRVPFLVINEIFVNPGRLEAYVPLFRDTLKSAAADLQAELDEEYRAGRVRKLDAVDFVLCVLSLNIGFFLTQPIYQTIFGPSRDDFVRKAAERKADNVEFVRRYLRD